MYSKKKILQVSCIKNLFFFIHLISFLGVNISHFYKEQVIILNPYNSFAFQAYN